MFRKCLVLAFALAGLGLSPRPAAAQDGSQVGEIVVTAERREGEAAQLSQPHVVVFRRADNLITEVQVDCDTRDPSARNAELDATLRNMIAAAAQSGGTIELSIQPEEGGVLMPLKPEALDDLVTGGQKPDTSMATLIVKTHILPDDTFEGASARIQAFVSKTKIVGRSLAARTGDWQLTLITPRQYRPQIVAAIAKDAADTMRPFGPGYGVMLTGLERPVAWSRSGALELALYIPYALTIEPAH